MSRAALVMLALVCACKRKEVPYAAPVKNDAAVRPIDAPPPIDAPAVEKKLGVQKIVVGDHSSCALLADATLRCWGKNGDGQLGDGTATDTAKPVKPNVRGVKDVVLGTAHTCALLDDESVACWGRINYGNKGSLLVPTGVPGIAKAKRLFAVGTASCATIKDGSFVCWGDVDHSGHLKLSGGTRANRVPTPSRGVDKVVAVTANGALREDGTVWFWGTDGEPQRTAMTDVIEVASTGDEICGLRRNGSVACAGPATRCAAAAPKVAPVAETPAPTKSPKKGTPKKGTKKKAPAKKTAKKTPAKKPTAKKPAKKAPAKTATVKRPGPRPGDLPIEVLRLPPAKHLAFDVGLCVVTKSDRLQCLDTKDACTVDSPWPGLASVDYVTGNCARATDGTTRCWSVESKSRLVRAIAGVSGAISVATSSSHGCALLGDQSVVCWGSNKHGALGRSQIDEDSSAEASVVTL